MKSNVARKQVSSHVPYVESVQIKQEEEVKGGDNKKVLPKQENQSVKSEDEED